MGERLIRLREGLMYKPTRLAAVVAAIGAAALMASSLAHGQVDGAVQYPPASAGKDAQPPPPAGMVPQSVSPRRIELGLTGASQPPAAAYRSRSLPLIDNDRLTAEPATPLRGSPQPSSAFGN